MRLSEADKKEFKELYFANYGVELSDPELLIRASCLLGMYEIALRLAAEDIALEKARKAKAKGAGQFQEQRSSASPLE